MHSRKLSLFVFFLFGVFNLSQEKKVKPLESFTVKVCQDVTANNIQSLKDEENLHENCALRVDLPEIFFDPKKEKEKKRIFKFIAFEFAKTSNGYDQEEIPELGMSTFQITNQITRYDKPQCNKTTKGNPKNCKEVRRRSSMEFFSVPFEMDKKFHRTYGQFNAGFNEEGDEEKYLIYHKDESVSAAFDYPDTPYPKLGVNGDAHVDLYEVDSHVWIPRCNKKENRNKCIKHATCGVRIKGKSDVEKKADFCCVCIPGEMTNKYPTPCGVNVTQRYESFKNGEDGCQAQEQSCPYNPNPMLDTKCTKTFGSCPMTCKCGTPKDMHPCLHPFTKKPKYPLYSELRKAKPQRKSDHSVGDDDDGDDNKATTTTSGFFFTVLTSVVLSAMAASLPF